MLLLLVVLLWGGGHSLDGFAASAVVGQVRRHGGSSQSLGTVLLFLSRLFRPDAPSAVLTCCLAVLLRSTVWSRLVISMSSQDAAFLDQVLFRR